jgi:Integrase core domain
MPLAPVSSDAGEWTGLVGEHGSVINSFWSLVQARVVIGDWKHDYNHHRRHSALGYLTPASYVAACTHR